MRKASKFLFAFLIKGKSWKGNDGEGIVRRSPYEEGNYHRLYMRIDFLETHINIYRNLK
ncbi:MAG: hypothetical protein CMF99_06475 [Candidatus Marinimicrobia bacterium]|nr:hypothetical protein [Candidatus Neomarinimicrobiota bacterium]